jgi:hypothetical protein
MVGTSIDSFANDVIIRTDRDGGTGTHDYSCCKFSRPNRQLAHLSCHGNTFGISLAVRPSVDVKKRTLANNHSNDTTTVAVDANTAGYSLHFNYVAMGETPIDRFATSTKSKNCLPGSTSTTRDCTLWSSRLTSTDCGRPC